MTSDNDFTDLVPKADFSRRSFLRRLLGLGLGATAGLVVPSLVQAESSPLDTAPSPADAPIPRTGKWIEVILSQQRLNAWENGKLVMTSLASTGTARYPTVRGNFRVYVKYRATRMRGPGYNLPNVPWTMYFYRGYGIHGAYWHNNFGRPMSHGCVNLPVPFSGRLFAWAPMGILVNVHY